MLKTAYELGVKLAMQEAGLVKEAGALGMLRKSLGAGGTGAAVGGSLGAGIGAIGGGLSDDGSAASGALKGLLIGGGIGAGQGLLRGPGAHVGRAIEKMRKDKALTKLVDEIGGSAGAYPSMQKKLDGLTGAALGGLSGATLGGTAGGLLGNAAGNAWID